MGLDDPEIFRSIAENLPYGLYLTDRERRVVFWNHQAERITGYAGHEVSGRCCRDGLLMHCDAEGNLLCVSDCPLSKALRDGVPQEGRVYLHHKAGHRVPVHVRAIPVRQSDGVIVGAVGTFEEESTLLFSERRQNTLAAHGCIDAVTGLPNHFIMQSHLRENLNLFEEHYLPFGVLVIEMDGIQAFEEAHSHEALSAMLHVLARSVALLLGPDSLLGEWTGSQFLAVVSDCNVLELERFRKQIRDLVRRSGIQWWGDHLCMRAQVGCAIVEAGDKAETVIDRALQSMRSHAARDLIHIQADSRQAQGS